MTPILEIRDLCKTYGRLQALRGVTFELPGPGIYGFLGPNGAGKTTTIKLIAGLLKPTAGTIRICGMDLLADPVSALRQIGVMMETPQFYPHLSGRGNLRVLARLSGCRDETMIDSFLERVGLSSKSAERVSTYSRGMRQRLGVAAAVLGQPRLVILDEPANGLDPAGIVEMRDWLREMTSQEERTVLISSHQMGEMERICDVVTIIQKGAIVATGRPEDLVRNKNSITVRTRAPQAAVETLRRVQGIDKIEVVSADQVRVKTESLSSGEINRVLVLGGVEVIAIAKEKESLEDVFFRLIGDSRDVA